MNEKQESNQIKIENQLYNLAHKIDALPVQKTPSENELKIIQEVIMSNTVRIMAESELQKIGLTEQSLNRSECKGLLESPN